MPLPQHFVKPGEKHTSFFTLLLTDSTVGFFLIYFFNFISLRHSAMDLKALHMLWLVPVFTLTAQGEYGKVMEFRTTLLLLMENNALKKMYFWTYSRVSLQSAVLWLYSDNVRVCSVFYCRFFFNLVHSVFLIIVLM